MLEHSSIGITVDTYHHLSEDSARAASDAMGALLDAAFAAAAGPARDHTATTRADTDTQSRDETDETAGQDGGPRGDRTHNPRIRSRCFPLRTSLRSYEPLSRYFFLSAVYSSIIRTPTYP